MPRRPPAPLHYLRNHGAVPKADWSTWTVEVAGLVKCPAKLTMEQLATKFEAVELPMMLVCASNRRKEQNTVRHTVGFNWGPGTISPLVRALDAAAAKERAAWVLCKLTENSYSVAELLSVCADNVGGELACAACWVLRRLAGIDEIRKYMVADAGAVPVLVSLS
ncbi:hypothetical protein U9M48_041147 [Paspalum notatum var. saurae]|uniref:Oxidoreductase molybdopterin-binding domain-containing protein n=1 Tax=Paspalum notatum var. saurae TaxID=547442 RepID=A0AAQ3URZ8_PASNO